MSMRERPRQQDEREPDGSGRRRDETGVRGGRGGRGEESYGGDPDAGPASTEQEAEQVSERKPAEG